MSWCDDANGWNVFFCNGVLPLTCFFFGFSNQSRKVKDTQKPIGTPWIWRANDQDWLRVFEISFQQRIAWSNAYQEVHSLPTFIKRYPGRPKIPTAYPNYIIRMLLRGTSSLSRLFYCYLELRITEPSHPANQPIGKLVPLLILFPFIALEGYGGHIKCSIDSPHPPPTFYLCICISCLFYICHSARENERDQLSKEPLRHIWCKTLRSRHRPLTTTGLCHTRNILTISVLQNQCCSQNACARCWWTFDSPSLGVSWWKGSPRVPKRIRKHFFSVLFSNN